MCARSAEIKDNEGYYIKKYVKCPVCKGTGRTECEEGFVKKFVKESI